MLPATLPVAFVILLDTGVADVDTGVQHGLHPP